MTTTPIRPAADCTEWVPYPQFSRVGIDHVGEHGLKTRDMGAALRVVNRLHETAYLNPALTIIFEDRRKAEVEHLEFHEPDGIIGFGCPILSLSVPQNGDRDA